MAGNAHRCVFCKMNGKQARAQGLPWENTNGHRKNTRRKKRGRKNHPVIVQK